MASRSKDKSSPCADAQLRAIREALELEPRQQDISNLFPMFAPASFFESGNWMGPFDLLKVPGLGLTWSIAQPQQTMRYLDHPTAKHWEEEGIDWRAVSLDNLERMSVARFTTGAFVRKGGPKDEYYALAFMHDDGYGASRLLFWEQLREVFPEGYLVALPEMSLGVALSLDATPAERAEIDNLVASCFKDGTRPLVQGLHRSSLLVPR